MNNVSYFNEEVKGKVRHILSKGVKSEFFLYSLKHYWLLVDLV